MYNFLLSTDPFEAGKNTGQGQIIMTLCLNGNDTHQTCLPAHTDTRYPLFLHAFNLPTYVITGGSGPGQHWGQYWVCPAQLWWDEQALGQDAAPGRPNFFYTICFCLLALVVLSVMTSIQWYLKVHTHDSFVNKADNGKEVKYFSLVLLGWQYFYFPA